MSAEWEVEEHTPNGDYVLHRDFDDGPDVFIAVNNVDQAFQVEVSAAQTDGKQLDQVIGSCQNFEAALDLAQTECKKWDAGRHV